MRTVDVIVNSYYGREWSCPDCGTFNTEFGLTETVKCVCCGAEFEVNLPEPD